MGKTALGDRDATKLAAQSMLRKGLGTYSEISALSGRSKEIIRYWAVQLGAENARQKCLEKIWAQALRRNK